MKRYWFQLLTNDYDDLDAFIPDGSSKVTAMNRAKRWKLLLWVADLDDVGELQESCPNDHIRIKLCR